MDLLIGPSLKLAYLFLVDARFLKKRVDALGVRPNMWYQRFFSITKQTQYFHGIHK